jgi:YD repeat-containing protein
LARRATWQTHCPVAKFSGPKRTGWLWPGVITRWRSPRRSDGLISEIAGPDGQTVTYSYSEGNLISVENQAGDYTYYSYDGSHDLLTMEDPDGDTTTNTYNDSAQVVTQTDPRSQETTFSYSVPGSNETATLMTDPDGNQTYFLFEWGLLIHKTGAYGTSSAATTTYTYHPNSLGMTSETNPEGETTTYTYDDSGNMLTETTPLGYTTTYSYSDLDEPLTITDPSGVTTTDTYEVVVNNASAVTAVALAVGQASSLPATGYGYFRTA